MGEYIQTLGGSISNLLGDMVTVVSNTFSSLLTTISKVVPGGLPIFVVLCAIAVLVGLASLRR